MRSLHKQIGTSFVELLISIIIIGVAAAGILQVMSTNAGSSADPMVRQQAIAIAEAYLDEILAKEFTDPDAIPSIEASRDLYDDINDYTAISGSAVQDQNGLPIGGLNGYSVTVTITGEAFGPTGAEIDAANARRITVTVKTPLNNQDVSVSGYRANY